MAVVSREIRPGSVHHSDRGVQYAAAVYIKLLTGECRLWWRYKVNEVLRILRVAPVPQLALGVAPYTQGDRPPYRHATAPNAA